MKALEKLKPNLTLKQQEAQGIFNAVSRNRMYVGQLASPLPIRESDIIDYINLHGCACYESDILIDIIMALDNDYLAAENERRKREANKHG